MLSSVFNPICNKNLGFLKQTFLRSILIQIYNLTSDSILYFPRSELKTSAVLWRLVVQTDIPASLGGVNTAVSRSYQWPFMDDRLLIRVIRPFLLRRGLGPVVVPSWGEFRDFTSFCTFCFLLRSSTFSTVKKIIT